jgi:long-chain-fatty-acid--[acyl-carrier-protein] ligase
MSEMNGGEADVDAVLTVRDLLAVAVGKSLSSQSVAFTSVPVRWFTCDDRRHDPTMPEGESILEVLVRRALAEPRTVILADQASGIRTYRDVLTGMFVLRPYIARLRGARVGLMMPASVGADVLFFAILAAGKTPVMVNWTVGPKQTVHGLEVTGTEVILTARALVQRLTAQGVEFGPYEDRFVFLEDIVQNVSNHRKLIAVAQTFIRPNAIVRGGGDETAVILFTSGSESLPKAVPLSHTNLLTNLRDISASVPFYRGDRLLSVLPPFHSFGLTAGVLMPLLHGIPTVHSPNPSDGITLATLVGAYQATLMGGTPTFLAAMMAHAAESQLESLRLVVTGGERCSERVFDTFDRLCPGGKILEGYGITECSPIVAINSPGEHKRGTIGRVLKSLEYSVVDMESGERCKPGQPGLLLVRGDSVFDGYTGPSRSSPFREFEERSWFNTGDAVAEDAGGFLTFHARLGRFVKRAGEVISLPAIEEALTDQLEPGEDDTPTIAVIGLGDDSNLELVLCTTLLIDRESVNQGIRRAGLSPLYSIQRVVRLPGIPALGTGKTDYRALEALLQTDRSPSPL